MKNRSQAGFVAKVAVAAVAVVAAILVLGTWWVGQSAQQATDEAVKAVSMFYLDELAGRREQVVETNLESNIQKMETAIGTLTEDDLSGVEGLRAFQARMKQLYGLEKFAFVDDTGTVYTALGILEGTDEYGFDYQTIDAPVVSVKDSDDDSKTVIIAIPLDGIPFNGETLVASFIEMDMNQMIEGLSLHTDTDEATFCNLYTSDGVALTDMVLGGLASEANLLEALKIADFADGYSYEGVVADFEQGKAGAVSFTYGDIQETLAYVPVPNTNWFVTYLVRESVISDQIGGISAGITMRSTLLTIATALVLLIAAAAMIMQTRKSAQLAAEHEAAEAENRVKQEEMEQRLILQEQLLQQEKQHVQQSRMITALASDYRSVYYVDLDTGEGICYQVDKVVKDGPSAGEHFPFWQAVAEYAERRIDEQYRQGFLEFIDPDAIRAGLADQMVISYRYLTTRNGAESYEMIRMAGVRHAEDRDDGVVHAVGVGFADVDNETREAMAQSQALRDALATAEEANKAKTVFLSNMSHEIRTPMNAIIGLDSIALSDEDLPERTRTHLEKIGESARHLLTLINDILDVSRIESGRMVIRNESFSFSKLIEQVNTIISSQCNEKGLEYTCTINGILDDAYIGDDMKLRQTLINVLGNAVKFTPAGGSVTFTVDRIAQYAGKSTLRFTMSDTGIGMDADFIPHIFDTFSQEDSKVAANYGSTGLGMAITKSIVELMNGTIEVESEKGVGTTFIITVTLGDAESSSVDLASHEIDPQSLNVLVIDDDPVACEHAKLVLQEVGISAEMAESGTQAVEMIRLRHARHDPFDLILVDWKMPEMDGVETTRQIRSITGDESAIIILTAYNWEDVLEEAIHAGVDSFIAKPLFASNVVDEFKEAFARKSEHAKAERAELTGRRVLLAEDVPINAEIIMEMLRMRGMNVEHAENGRIAVEMFAESDSGYYDVILMDMRMPEMGGLEATGAIRALDHPDAKTVPIIALSANAFDEDVEKSLQAGLNAHLSKPVEPDVLYDALETFIR